MFVRPGAGCAFQIRLRRGTVLLAHRRIFHGPGFVPHGLVDFALFAVQRIRAPKGPRILGGVLLHRLPQWLGAIAEAAVARDRRVEVLAVDCGSVGATRAAGVAQDLAGTPARTTAPPTQPVDPDLGT